MQGGSERFPTPWCILQATTSLLQGPLIFFVSKRKNHVKKSVMYCFFNQTIVSELNLPFELHIQQHGFKTISEPQT